MGLWIAIIGALFAMLTETVVFWKRREFLKTKEQCFKFHDLRDRLQVLTIEHKIETHSKLHDFLLSMINIAIRNAGVIKLSELVDISQSVKKEADDSTFSTIQTEIGSHPDDVQTLASEVFDNFAWMLVANDDLTVWLFKGLIMLSKIANEAVVRFVKLFVSKVAPEHAQVVREANDFARLGQRLARSY
jgi:hypothetical protein